MDKMIYKALRNMGYRKLKDGIFAKPVGFILMVAEVNDNKLVIKSQFTSKQGEQMIYGHSEFDTNFDEPENELFDHLTWLIARIEYEASICDAVRTANIGSEKTYAFHTPEELLFDMLKTVLY